MFTLVYFIFINKSLIEAIITQKRQLLFIGKFYTGLYFWSNQLLKIIKKTNSSFLQAEPQLLPSYWASHDSSNLLSVSLCLSISLHFHSAHSLFKGLVGFHFTCSPLPNSKTDYYLYDLHTYLTATSFISLTTTFPLNLPITL